MRVLLADDQPEVRLALRLLLGQETEIDVVGEAVEAVGLLAQLRATRPDMVLLDWELPGLEGFDLLPVVRSLCPRLVIVALSGRPEAAAASLTAGADAFVSKGDTPDRLLATLCGIGSRCGVDSGDDPGTETMKDTDTGGER